MTLDPPYWFAYNPTSDPEDNQPPIAGFPWQPVLQQDISWARFDTWFPTKEACESFIRTIPAGTMIDDRD